MCRLPLLIATPEQLQQINNNNTHQTTDGQPHCQTSFSTSSSSSSHYYQQATADDTICNSATTPNTSDCSAATTATSTFLAKYFSHQPAASVAEDDKEDVEIVKKNEEDSAQSHRVEERREQQHHPNLLLFNSLQSTITEKQQQNNNSNPEELPSSCPSLMEMSPGNGLIKPEAKVQRTQWLQHETATLRQKFAPEFKQIIPSVADCLRRAVDSAPKAVSNEHQRQYALFETPVDLVHDTAAAANPALYFECFLEYLTFEALLSPSTVIGAFVLLDRLLLKLGGGGTEISPSSSISDDVTSASASSAGSGFFRNRLFNEIQHSRSSCSAAACDSSKRLYLTGFNTPKLFATATRIASKILEHSTVTNTHFAEAARVFPKTLLSMEARFLELLEWDCHISTEDFTRYAECLQNDNKKKFQQAEELKLKKLREEEEQQQLVELDEPKMLVEIVSAAENDDDDDEHNLSIVSVEDEEEDNTDNKQRTPLQTLEGNAAGFDSTSSMLSVQSTARGVSSEHVVVMTKNSTAMTRLLDDDDNLSIDSSSDCDDNENPLFAAKDEQVFGMDSFIDSPPPHNHQNQKEPFGLAAPAMAMVTFNAKECGELPDLLTPPMLPEKGMKKVHSGVVIPDEVQVRW